MKIENAVPYIGALVTGLDVKRMTNSEWQTLYQTWLDRHVLIVRGQELSKADFLAYSRRFGRLKPHMIKRTRDPDNPEITLMGVTSMAKDSGGAALILNRGEGWHTDSPWDTEICKDTQLYGIEIPSYGGDTLFASMHVAYDALPERLKERIAPLKVAFRYGGRERKWFDLLEPADQARPPAAIPPTSGASIGAPRSCSERDRGENGPWLANEPPIFLFGHPIGRAGHLLDAVAAEDRDLIAAGLDQLLLLKALQRLGDAGPAHAEHQRQKFVGERQRLVAGAVLGHQNPSRQTPVDLGPRVGDGRVGRLHHEGLNVFQQQGVQ
jgi:hypothetical protein